MGIICEFSHFYCLGATFPNHFTKKITCMMQFAFAQFGNFRPSYLPKLFEMAINQRHFPNDSHSLLSGITNFISGKGVDVRTQNTPSCATISNAFDDSSFDELFDGD